MSSRQQTNIQHQIIRLGFVALCSLLAISFPIFTPTAQAAPPGYGYLWELVFDFEEDFNGVLKIEVGPWQDGNLAWIEETSETIIECTPSGRISRTDGFANFGGSGFLTCEMDIAQIVLDKHNLVAEETDTYGSFIMQTDAVLLNENPAPIFNHPDAAFRLDPLGPIDIYVINDISNEHGPIQALFSGITWNTLHTYNSDYVCIPDLQCDLAHHADTTEITLTEQGEPITFTTGPTTFTIGKDDANIMTGRIDSILIDPGNFVHQIPGFALHLPMLVREDAATD
jgi:hypothetical protein